MLNEGSVLTHRPFFIGPASTLSAIMLAIISFLSGFGWMLDRKKHRQEVEALRADVKQKELDLSKDYVTEWRTKIPKWITALVCAVVVMILVIRLKC